MKLWSQYVNSTVSICKFSFKCHSQHSRSLRQKWQGPGEVFSSNLCWFSNLQFLHRVLRAPLLRTFRLKGLRHSKMVWWDSCFCCNDLSLVVSLKFEKKFRYLVLLYSCFFKYLWVNIFVKKKNIFSISWVFGLHWIFFILF